MKESERRRWETRFDYVDRVWENFGLTGRTFNADGFDLVRAMKMYRGEMHWAGIIGYAEPNMQTIANSIFDAVNTTEAQIMARAPRALLFPHHRGNAQNARIAQVALNYYKDELQFKRHVNRAQKDSLFAPFGFIIHGYTPDEEYEDDKGRRLDMNGPRMSDTPWICRKPIWDVRGDVLRGTLHPEEMGWFSFRDFFTPEQIRRNPGMKGFRDKEIKPTHKFTAEEMIPSGLEIRTSEDYNTFVEVWTVYDRLEQKWFQWSDGVEDKIIREPDDWPIPWGGLPCSIIGFNDNMDTPFPEPYVHALMPIQEERNKIRTMMSVIARSLRRIVGVAYERLDDQSKERIKAGDLELMEFLLSNSDSANDLLDEVQIGSFPSDLMNYDRVLKEDIRELMGHSNMDRGQRINVETAEEAGNVQSGSDIHRGRNQSIVEEHWSDVFKKWTAGWRSIPRDESTLIPIVGIEDVQSLVAVQGLGGTPFPDGEPLLNVPPEVIEGNYLVKIQTGSTMPRSRAEDIAMADSWLELISQFPEQGNIQHALIQSAQARGFNPAVVLQTPEGERTTRDQVTQNPGPAVQPAPRQGGGGLVSLGPPRGAA